MTLPTTRRALHLLLVSLLTIALDQGSKYWLVTELGLAARPPIVLTDFFSLVMVWNHGVSFGMLSHAGSDWAPYLLIALALVISGIMARIALKTVSVWDRLAYGMIIGGALGNAIDRVRIGAVADFFYLHYGTLGWPAFNIADSAICIGVSILLITMLRNSKVAA